jgi:hypothetical protein
VIKAYPNNMTNIAELICWLDNNTDIARWSMGKAIIFEQGRVYISSIEFDNEADYVYCSLKFNLRKHIERMSFYVPKR